MTEALLLTMLNNKLDRHQRK